MSLIMQRLRVVHLGAARCRTFIDLATVDTANFNARASFNAAPKKQLTSFWRSASYPEFTAAANPMRRTTPKKARVAIPGDAFGLHRPTGYGW